MNFVVRVANVERAGVKSKIDLANLSRQCAHVFNFLVCRVPLERPFVGQHAHTGTSCGDDAHFAVLRVTQTHKRLDSAAAQTRDEHF